MQAEDAVGHLYDDDDSPSEWVMISSATQKGKSKHVTVNRNLVIQPT